MAFIKQITLPDGNTYDVMIDEVTGATASTPGSAGAVPAPGVGDQNKFLMGNGTWQSLGDIDIEALSRISVFMENLIQIEVSYPDEAEGATVTCTDGTVTKTLTVDETHKVLFGFGKYGVYTVTDDYSNTPLRIKAYHYGYYPYSVPHAAVGSYVGAFVNQ